LILTSGILKRPARTRTRGRRRRIAPNFPPFRPYLAGHFGVLVAGLRIALAHARKDVF